MTEREKLIKLLDDGCRKAYDDITGKRVNEFVADHLLENGVIVPPCKVGDTVYVEAYGEITNAYVCLFEVCSKTICAKLYIDPDTYEYYDIENVFLTREEAEKALDEITKGTAQNGLAYATPNFELIEG